MVFEIFLDEPVADNKTAAVQTMELSLLIVRRQVPLLAASVHWFGKAVA